MGQPERLCGSALRFHQNKCSHYSEYIEQREFEVLESAKLTNAAYQVTTWH